MHQDISELKTLFINHHRWHCVWKSPVTENLQVEFRDKTWTLVVSGIVMIWKEGHVWMPQSWKQGQVWLIPKKDKPQTIGDAQPITLLSVHHNMHSHMVAWWLRNSMTTLCLASHCAFIASTDTSLYHCPNICKFLPILSFSLKSYWQHRLNSETSSNCKLQKNFKNLLQLEECGLYFPLFWLFLFFSFDKNDICRIWTYASYGEVISSHTP